MSLTDHRDLRASYVRTFTPLLVSAVLAIGARLGLEGDAEALSEPLGALGALAYYVAVRYLETHRSGRFGWLLGSARQPVYGPRAQAPAPGVVEPVRLDVPARNPDGSLVEAAEHHAPVAPSSVPTGRRAPRQRPGRSDGGWATRELLAKAVLVALVAVAILWVLTVAFAR